MHLCTSFGKCRSIPTLYYVLAYGRVYPAVCRLREGKTVMEKCLVVVDYQKDFVDGSLGFPGARETGSRIAQRIRTAREQNEEVIFTKDTHNESYLTTHEGKRLPVRHCLRNTPGWEIAGPVAALVRDDDLVLEKETFGSAQLFDYLRSKKYSEVEVCGLVTDICVAANAVLARTALPQADIIVDAALTDTADPDRKEAALAALESLQIDVRRLPAAGGSWPDTGTEPAG